jgi:iron complex outermembrane receptor protein
MAVFTNRFDNFIFPRNTGELGRQGERWKFQYSGRDVDLSGGEIQFSATPIRSLAIDANASIVIGRILGERDSIPAVGDLPGRISSGYLPLLPAPNGRLGARWDRPSWFAGGAMRWSARQTRTGDFETETPAYQVAELSAGLRRVLQSRLHTFTLRVDNVFDTEYRDHLSRTKDVIPEAGRSVSLLYRVLF